MSNIIKSHFYIVKGTPKGNVLPTIGWLFHSYKELEEFALFVIDLIPEYDLEIQETNFNESEIIEKWEYSKDTLEEYRKWIHEPKCRLDSDGLGHLWVYPYQHEIESRERFDEEFPPLPYHL